ncbi:hypothetical protein C8Q73DRAFT_793410 [Cubamyces lactineus]|nr:hypothetical protein C8Q73DRAFT_793410 [Cubamyces lactineus]
MVCPCGEYRHQNASLVRRHAALKHKSGSDASHELKDHSSPMATTSTTSQAFSAQTGAASSRGAKPSAPLLKPLKKPAFVQQNRADLASTSMLHSALDHSSTSKSSVKLQSHLQQPTVAFLKRSREMDVEVPVKSHEKGKKPAKAPRISTTTASELPAAGPSSSPRPISSWRQRIVPTPKGLPTSRARPVPRAVDTEVRDSSIEDDEDTTLSSPSSRSRLRGELECSRCFTTLECKPDDRRLRREWTCDACRGQPPRTQAIAPGPRVSHTSPVRSEAGPSSAAKATVRTGTTSEGTLHRDATPATSRNQSRPFASASLVRQPADPRLSKAAPGRRIDTDSDIQDDKRSDAPTGAAAPAKPRRTRISKQMRAKQFRRWFDCILQEHRAQEAAGSTSTDLVSDNRYRPMEKLRKAGGTAYTTADEFFDALRQRVLAHNEKLKQGAKDVLHFHGGYAIVAQPKTGVKLRLEQFKAQLHNSGLPIDDEHFMFSYKNFSGDDISMSTSYSCSCGGISDPEPRLKKLHEDVENMGPCRGTIWVEVGNDESLAMYGIKGQYMQVAISH